MREHAAVWETVGAMADLEVYPAVKSAGDEIVLLDKLSSISVSLAQTYSGCLRGVHK